MGPHVLCHPKLQIGHRQVRDSTVGTYLSVSRIAYVHEHTWRVQISCCWQRLKQPKSRPACRRVVIPQLSTLGKLSFIGCRNIGIRCNFHSTDPRSVSVLQIYKSTFSKFDHPFLYLFSIAYFTIKLNYPLRQKSNRLNLFCQSVRDFCARKEKLRTADTPAIKSINTITQT